MTLQSQQPQTQPINPEKPETSTAASAEATLSKEYDQFHRYMLFQWGPHAAAIHLRNLYGVANWAMPAHTYWKIPQTVDIPKLLYERMLQDGYFASIWPTIKFVLGTNLNNTEWAARIATTITLIDLIKELSVERKANEPRPTASTGQESRPEVAVTPPAEDVKETVETASPAQPRRLEVHPADKAKKSGGKQGGNGTGVRDFRGQFTQPGRDAKKTVGPVVHEIKEQ